MELFESMFLQSLKGGNESSFNISLGRLEKRLEGLNEESIIKLTNGFYLTGRFGSYRGYYEDMYLDMTSEEEDAITIRQLKDVIKKAYSQKNMEGYKGGIFSITEETLVWAAYQGVVTGLMLMDIFEEENYAICIVEEEENKI